MSISWPHALSVWQRNASMYRRTWRGNLLPNFFEPIFYLTAIGIGVGAYIQEMGGTSYVQFLVPGLLCVSAMNGASFEVTYNFFVRLHFEKSFDAMLTTPLEPDDVLAGEVVWALTRACIYGSAFYLVSAGMGYAPLPHSAIALLVVPLAAVLFSALGIAFSLHVEHMDKFSFYFTLFLTPLFLFSGVFFPLEERLPPAGLWVAEALPLLHPVRLARAAFDGGPFHTIHLWDLSYIALGSLAMLAWARRRIRSRLTT